MKLKRFTLEQGGFGFVLPQTVNGMKQNLRCIHVCVATGLWSVPSVHPGRKTSTVTPWFHRVIPPRQDWIVLNVVPNKWFTFIHSFNKQSQKIQQKIEERIPPLLTVRRTTKYYVFRSFCWLDSIFPVSPGGRGSLLSIISIPVLHQLQTLQHKSLVLLTLQVQPVVESHVEHFLLLLFFFPCTVISRVGGWGLMSCLNSCCLCFCSFHFPTDHISAPLTQLS